VFCDDWSGIWHSQLMNAFPRRYHTDPSGTFVRYDAKAIGSGSDAAQQSLQDAFHKVRSASLTVRSCLQAC